MNYEVKNADFYGAPVDSGTDPLSRIWDISVESGIVGQTYKGFTNSDLTKFTFLKTDSQTQIEDKMQAAAIAFVATKYPNT